MRLHGKGGSNWQKLFLAMAYQRLGQTDKSRVWFDKAKLDDKASGSERLIYHRLHQEAEQLRKASDK